MFKTSLRVFIAGIFLPLVFSGMMYVGSTTAYTWGTFNKAGFHQQYDQGIYRYRLLGRESLLYFQGLIERKQLPPFKPGVFRDALKVDSSWYAAYFYNNSLYLCLACCALFFVFLRTSDGRYQAVEMPLLGLTLLMTITQYVVVPYDTLSYFFLCIGMYFGLVAKQGVLSTAMLGLAIVLGTLTRETAFLLISFYVAVHYKAILLHNPLKGVRLEQWRVLLFSSLFLVSYIALRLHYGFSKGMFEDFQLFKSLHITAIAGFCFLLLLLLNLFITKPVPKAMKVYLFTSAPYTLMIVLVAMPNEMRLWVPILLPLIVLKLCSPNDTLSCEGTLHKNTVKPA